MNLIRFFIVFLFVSLCIFCFLPGRSQEIIFDYGIYSQEQDDEDWDIDDYYNAYEELYEGGK